MLAIQLFILAACFLFKVISALKMGEKLPPLSLLPGIDYVPRDKDNKVYPMDLQLVINGGRCYSWPTPGVASESAKAQPALSSKSAFGSGGVPDDIRWEALFFYDNFTQGSSQIIAHGKEKFSISDIEKPDGTAMIFVHGVDSADTIRSATYSFLHQDYPYNAPKDGKWCPEKLNDWWNIPTWWTPSCRDNIGNCKAA